MKNIDECIKKIDESVMAGKYYVWLEHPCSDEALAIAYHFIKESDRYGQINKTVIRTDRHFGQTIDVIDKGLKSKLKATNAFFDMILK
jgi:hypothetical protein